MENFDPNFGEKKNQHTKKRTTHSLAVSQDRWTSEKQKQSEPKSELCFSKHMKVWQYFISLWNVCRPILTFSSRSKFLCTCFSSAETAELPPGPKRDWTPPMNEKCWHKKIKSIIWTAIMNQMAHRYWRSLKKSNTLFFHRQSILE